MASLSTYASRFLSSGLGASIRGGVNDADPSNDPLFYSHASVAPFSHPNNRHNPYAPEYSLSSSDGLPAPNAHVRPPSSSGLLHSLTGASRYGSASFVGTSKPKTASASGSGAHPNVRDSMIREMDDEEDVDLWRDERRMSGMASRLGASTASDELEHSQDNVASPQLADSQDPFLADGDLEDDRDDHTSAIPTRGRDRSLVTSPTHIYSQAPAAIPPHQDAAKARGWLAHGSTTTLPSPGRKKSKPKSSFGKRSRDAAASASHLRLPADIYRNPDDDDQDLYRSRYSAAGGDASSVYGRSSLANSARFEAKRASRGRSQTLYSIYDDEEQQSGSERSSTSRSRSASVSASSVTDSESGTDDGRHSSERRTSRRDGKSTSSKRRTQSSRNRARNMSSTLRDPLLPHGSTRFHHGRRSSDRGLNQDDSSATESESTRHHSGRHRPKLESDGDNIYVYPAPPARAGWGPWANRLAFGKYRDKTAIGSFVAAVLVTLVIGLYMSWGIKSPSPPKNPHTRPSSYYTITRSLPILVLLTLLSFAAGLGNLLLLRNIGRLGGAKVLRSGLMGVPIVLSLGWTWALAGSFIYDDEAWSGGGWSTVGLRLLSIIPLALAIMFAHMVWSRRKALSKSIAVLELSCSIVLNHPALLVLAVASLVFFLLVTIPFLFLFTRLFLVGHFGKPIGDATEWKTDKRAAWLAWATLATWLWTWAVLRGIQRVTVAGVVSHWYFNRISEAAAGGNGGIHQPVARKDLDRRQADDDQSDYIYGDNDDSIYGPGPSAPGAYHSRGGAASSNAAGPGNRSTAGGGLSASPDPTEIVRVSFARATGPAFGSICMAALILSIVKTLTVIAEMARRIQNAASDRRVPALLQPLAYVVVLLAGLGGILQGYSNLALAYVGITGDGFWTATKKSAQLVGRRGVRGVMEDLIINLVLDLTAIALSFLAGVAGFLFSAHQLHVPADAPLVGLLCAIVPYWTLRLCADVLSNASDTLYLCYAIDQASNDDHCPKASEAFTTTAQESVLPF